MSDIEDLQARITVALDRVAKGVDQLSASDAGKVEALEAQVEAEKSAVTQLQAQLDSEKSSAAQLATQLEEEKTVTAQLEERLKTLKEKQTAELDELKNRTQETTTKVEALDLELQRLRQANTQLRDANAALRQANEAGVGEPHLINKSMLAELEGLRAARAADIAEASAILSALTPILSSTEEKEEAADA